MRRQLAVRPLLPALYLADAVTILFVLFVYRTATPWPDLIVLLGAPVYFTWKPKSSPALS